VALLLSGCASPNPGYYTLRTVPGPVRPGGPATVEIRRVGLAGYLDRNAIIRDNNGLQLNVAPNEVWGEPLGDLITGKLAEDLTQRLPGSTVFTEQGAISANAAATVEVNVQRFDAEPDGSVILLAQAAVEDGQGHNPTATRTIRVEEHPASQATADYVAALSTALGALSDQLAQMLVKG
jgi:uncharacterized lipoprotein YmbA